MRVRVTSLLKDTISLYAIQGLNYLFPLLLLPVLVRAVGQAGFGTLNLALALGGYVQVVGDFGFSLTGTRQMALAKDDPARRDAVIMEITWAKVAILLAIGAPISVIPWIVPSWRPDAFLFLLAIAASAGNSLFPGWLFQGMQRMVPSALISVAAKAANLLLVLLLVKSPDDLSTALWINLALAWAQTIAAYALAAWSWKIRCQFVSIRSMISQYRDSASVFLSQIGVLFYSNTNILVLGLYCDRAEVGAFSLAEKIIRAASFLTAPICSAIYPRVCKLLEDDVDGAVLFLRRIILGGGAFFAVVAVLLVWQSSLLLHLLSPTPPAQSYLVMAILAILPLSIFTDNLYGTQILLGSGRNAVFAKAILASGLCALLLQQILIPWQGAVGAAICLMASEALLLSQFVFHVRKMDIRLVPALGV